MHQSYNSYRSLLLVLSVCLFLFITCTSKKKSTPLFEVMHDAVTGLHFTNTLKQTPVLNMLKYMYFYNGAGVGAGDFNNDGLIDLFFASSQQRNRLYLNEGKLKFRDVTDLTGIPDDSSWSTGVSVVDINNDGLLDIYVCRVGNYESLKSHNQLLICQGVKDGVPYYIDKSKEYGLDFSGFSTQAAFFDYDQDGDLDMYLLNHSLRYNSTFAARQTYSGTYDSLSGHRMYRNDGNYFTNVTRESGINSSVIGYGLGIAVSDINLDGYPDLYIGNDFHENDYLYINQQDGTFRDEINSSVMHTSQFSMGVDIADITNDGFPEIISMDMLPSDPYILKRSLGEDSYDLFNYKIKFGYNYQYARNTLQLNRRNGMFSEIGLYAGIDATDWSWAALFMDFDNDGLKDLFVSNGIPKRLNDIDYVNYISNTEVQQKIRSGTLEEKEMAVIDKFPQIKLSNRFFRNIGNAVFEDIEDEISENMITYSNGAAYADLDNDGDLDVVVNNIEDPVIIYRNTSNDAGSKEYMQISLRGPVNNLRALGAKMIVYAGNEIRTYEKFPVRGFQSSMEIPLHIGLAGTKVDSMLLIWPDNTYQHIINLSAVQSIAYVKGLPEYDYDNLKKLNIHEGNPATDMTENSGLKFLHQENAFVEFDREPLMPHMISTEGPALAVADINHDGYDDVFIGSSKWQRSAVFVQSPDGKFSRTLQPALNMDSTYEDVDACWVDVNNDGHLDLVIAAGGNEYFGTERFRSPRIYLNDGNANLSLLENAFSGIFLTASCIKPADINGDGYIDLFIGGRAVPWEYGKIPRSYLLLNNKAGKFTDITHTVAKDLAEVGFVTNGEWIDIDRDGDDDLVLSLEWDGIVAFLSDKGKFTKTFLTQKKGWWNFVLPVDVDNDGDIDIIAGNLGLNSRLSASASHPVKMYYTDFDDNGKKEQVITYYIGNRELPFANKAELEKQIPLLKKKFLYAEHFAKASLDELFSRDKLENATIFSADYFENAILLNDGNMKFTIKALPPEAQLAPYRDAAIIDANNDSLPDVLLGGNYYQSNIQLGRYDADMGTVLVNRGNGEFKSETVNGVKITGQIRRIRRIRIGEQTAYLLARNNDSLAVIRFE